MIERADELRHDNALARSTALVQVFFFGGKASRHLRLSAPLQPRFGSLRLLAFPELKSPLKGKKFVIEMVTQYTSSVNGVSLPTE